MHCGAQFLGSVNVLLSGWFLIGSAVLYLLKQQKRSDPGSRILQEMFSVYPVSLGHVVSPVVVSSQEPLQWQQDLHNSEVFSLWLLGGRDERWLI